jgi:hypothetical protein
MSAAFFKYFYYFILYKIFLQIHINVLFIAFFSQLIQFSRFLEKFEVRMFEDTKGVIRSRKSKDRQ